MELSCCLWGLPGSDIEQMQQAAELGFTTVDIQPHMLHSAASQQTRRELGLSIGCVGISFGLGPDSAFDSPDESLRQQAIREADLGVRQAAAVGAHYVYVVPTFAASAAALARYATSMKEIAEIGAELGIKVGIEHFPGRALGTAAATLAFVNEVGHDNLYLLFDLGHIQISGEDPVAVIEAAGDRLGYVHLDDNDGVGDLHWSLLAGVMTRQSLTATLIAVAASPYTGPVSLELHPQLPDPVQALRESRALVLGL